MSSKKIAVIGTHYVGKTTLIKFLSEELKKRKYRVGIITEVVRDCPHPVNEIATLNAQDWILNEQKRRESELDGKHDIILMDRGLIDNFAYWQRVAEMNNLSKKEIKQKEKEVFEHTKGYDMLLFLHPFEGNTIEDDNFRSVDPVWRVEMHKRIFKIVRKFSKENKTPIIHIKGTKKEVFQKSIRYVSKILT